MAFRCASGTYTGNGSDNRDITVSPTFVVKFVLIKRADAASTTSGGGWMTLSNRTDQSMSASDNADGLKANVIQSLGTGTFQVGTDSGSNGNGVTYYWIAIGGDDTEVKVGSYTGNGGNNPITGVGFAPGMVMVIGNNSNGNTSRVGRWGTSSTDTEWWLNGQSVTSGGGQQIKSLDADGFTVGSDATVGTNGNTYVYCAVKTVSGYTKAGTYTGTGSSLGITGVGFQPQIVITTNGDGGGSGSTPVFTSTSHPSDNTSNCRDNIANFSGGITSLDSDGFTVGTNGYVNRNGVAAYYMAFKDATPTTSDGNFLAFM